MNIKMKWKRLLIGFLCMMLLACNAGSVFAEDMDIYAPTVSGNDISGNDSKGESGDNKTEESGTEQDSEGEPGREPGTEASDAAEDLLSLFRWIQTVMIYRLRTERIQPGRISRHIILHQTGHCFLKEPERWRDGMHRQMSHGQAKR